MSSVSPVFQLGKTALNIPMILKAAIGVAMGNASPKVKESADYISDAVDDVGVAKAFKHFGLI